MLHVYFRQAITPLYMSAAGAGLGEGGLGEGHEEEEGEDAQPPAVLSAEGVRQLGGLMDGIEHDFLAMVCSFVRHSHFMWSPSFAA